jgi:hypothetical protein
LRDADASRALPCGRFRALRFVLTLGLYLGGMQLSGAAERWFEEVKATATPVQLYKFLYAMPKGGDLHNHLGGAVRSEWFWDAAMAAERRGYVYYTRVRIMNCAPYGHDEFGASKALLAFQGYSGEPVRSARCVRQVRVQTIAGSRRAREAGLARQHASRSEL